MPNPRDKNPGCLSTLLRWFGASSKPATAFPYRVRDDFLSPAEHSLYQVLKNLFGDKLTICPKVLLSNIFYVVRPDQNQSAKNRINQKHVDFLVCESKTMEPLFAIELADRSHRRSDRIDRDALVDGVFIAASLPLLRITARAAYNTAELEQRLEGVLQKTRLRTAGESPAGSTPIEATGAPLCPKCGETMVLRTAKKGDHLGSKFYGCPNYPKCRETLRLKE